MTDADGTNARTLLPRAAEIFRAHVHAVDDVRWCGPTPCRDWTVRNLVNHMTSEHLWAPELLSGRSVAEIGDAYAGDVLGEDPVAAWDAAIDASLRAWSTTRDSATVNLSRGETPVTEYAEEMLLDLLVHGWDLGRGLGSDARLDPELVEHVLAYVEPRADDVAASGFFGSPSRLDPPDGDPQARLLVLLGRSPTWPS